MAVVLVVAGHAALGLALWTPLGPVGALGVAIGFGAVTAQRTGALFRYRADRRSVTEWFDLPALCHAVASLGSLGAGALAVATGLDMARMAAFGYAVSLPLAAYAIWGQRSRLCVRRATLPVSGLPPSFAGYRIVQLSDLHLGPFHPLSRALGWIRAANRVRADLCVVTGDLMARGADTAPDVLTAIGALRARDGVVVVLGNHDRAEADWLTGELRLRGVTVLRNQWHRVEHGQDGLWVLGLDDWPRSPDELAKLIPSCPSGPPTLLVAHRHDPRMDYGRLGLGLALFGHTHGGQLGLPGAGRWVNLATLTGQRARGRFRLAQGWGYVTAGLGTSGPPLRFGVPPEIALLVLVPCLHDRAQK